MHTTTFAPTCFSAASASGVEREPGAIQNVVTPPRTSSPTSTVAQAAFGFGMLANVGAGDSSISSGFVFKFNSLHSALAFAEPTTPTPAYRVTSFPPGAASADRMATANSAPSALIHPSGPAYNPRSKDSTARNVCNAALRGYPHTAGVGCNALIKSASVFPRASGADRRAYKCCTATLRKIPFSISILTPSMPPWATSASALLTSSRTMANSSCSLGLKSISYAKAASSPSSAPRARVPATASLAAYPLLLANNRSGVEPKNVAPFG
mmetsp:Transcript_7779/g.28616  ORF Transcript_7779/g.28616 Transcript_7779/m.28616 type:complete len:268 (+) Transcript_7779:4306-5109(+)